MNNIREGDVGLGGILLIIGFIGFFFGYSITQQYGGVFGQLELALSSEARQRFQIGQLMAFGGGILAIIGLVVVIYGAAAKSERT